VLFDAVALADDDSAGIRKELSGLRRFHPFVFAGSGGFKKTSVTIPTALKWGGTLVLLDPSNEVAPMVIGHRTNAGRD
ncbi:type IV secretory system conjugative DNA transfer family protein, partial [Rhizobium ruizarguesonis]